MNSLVTVSVIVSKSLQCLCFSALAHKETGRFRGEENETNLDNGWKSLDDGGDTP